MYIYIYIYMYISMKLCLHVMCIHVQVNDVVGQRRQIDLHRTEMIDVPNHNGLAQARVKLSQQAQATSESQKQGVYDQR